MRPEIRLRDAASLFPPGTRLIARPEDGEALQLSIVGTTPSEELVVRVPVQGIHFSKRRFHRSAVDLELTIKAFPCRALDLSGCGILAHVPAEAQVLHRDIVEAQLVLGKGPVIHLKMFAVRTGEGPYGSRLIGFDFVDIGVRDQDRIVAYVLQQERKRVQALRGRA